MLFADQSFQSGLVGRAEVLGDRTVRGTWKVRDGTGGRLDVLIVVAADTEVDVESEVNRVKELIEKIGGATQVRDDEKGENRPDETAGHEHFGFLTAFPTGTSRPRLRRPYGFADSLAEPAGPEPGQTGPGARSGLVSSCSATRTRTGAGRQRTRRRLEHRGAGDPRVPNWAKDGSYLVFRLFKQVRPRVPQVPPDRGQYARRERGAGRRAVARAWASGAPVMRAPTHDNKELADNDCANNHFGFMEENSAGRGRIQKRVPSRRLPGRRRLSERGGVPIHCPHP